MAKISTYPVASSPSGSDLVIGTDAVNSNQTKNFAISDILALGNLSSFVPYTGATNNVDLGGNNLTSAALYANVLQLQGNGGYVLIIPATSSIFLGG